MQLTTIKNSFILSAGLLIAACATTTGVLPKSDGLYTINVANGSMAKVKLRAYQHAEKFCVEKSTSGIEVVKEDLRVDPTSPSSGIIDLDFRCKGPVDSEYGKKVLKELKKDEAKKVGS